MLKKIENYLKKDNLTIIRYSHKKIKKIKVSKIS